MIPRFAEMNVFGSNIKGYGCPGLNNTAYGLIMQELERADSGIRSFCSVQGALVMLGDFQLWIRSSKATVFTGVGSGETGWLFWLNGA